MALLLNVDQTKYPKISQAIIGITSWSDLRRPAPAIFKKEWRELLFRMNE